jgi:hypothetical protein
MIQMPRRSVTRFFIPMIDVLTLLFAMFLLMPVFEEHARLQEGDRPVSTTAFRKDMEIARLSHLLEEARQKQVPLTAREREEMERLRDENRRLLAEVKRPIQERFAVFVLGIDSKSGLLFYYDPLEANKKVILRTAADARKLIDRQRKIAGDRDPYFLFQEPQGKSRFPIGSQRDEYEKWFKGVKHGFESPGSGS